MNFYFPINTYKFHFYFLGLNEFKFLSALFHFNRIFRPLNQKTENITLMKMHILKILRTLKSLWFQITLGSYNLSHVTPPLSFMSAPTSSLS